MQKREQEPLKDPLNKAKLRHAASGQAQRNRMPSETPEDAERVSTTSGNMFDETRNNFMAWHVVPSGAMVRVRPRAQGK